MLFTLRLTEKERVLLDKAAQREKRSLANFMTFYSVKRAKELLGEKDVRS
jgi:uncharacterized protein (DUF1778 family)